MQHTYAKPGTYEIKADGARAEDLYLPCMGKVKYMHTVEAAAAKAGAATTSACPEGWGLKGKAAKDGSFTCTPKAKGAKKPEGLGLSGQRQLLWQQGAGLREGTVRPQQVFLP